METNALAKNTRFVMQYDFDFQDQPVGDAVMHSLISGKKDSIEGITACSSFARSSHLRSCNDSLK
jgi:hypothetical protein